MAAVVAEWWLGGLWGGGWGGGWVGLWVVAGVGITAIRVPGLVATQGPKEDAATCLTEWWRSPLWLA